MVGPAAAEDFSAVSQLEQRRRGTLLLGARSVLLCFATALCSAVHRTGIQKANHAVLHYHKPELLAGKKASCNVIG
jgi:hypothetical protein